RHNGTGWDEEQILSAAADEQANADFGTSVDLDGDAMIVGAPRYDVPAGLGAPYANAGKAYVFRYNSGSGVWSEEDQVTAADAAPLVRFGESVSISGSRAAVGAPGADYQPDIQLPTPDTGAAYIFAESGGSWSQTHKVHASDRDEDDGF